MGELFCPVGPGPERTCKGEGCAWWDRATGKCAVFLLHLGRIPQSHVAELEERINHLFSILKQLEERVTERLKLANDLFRENLELLDFIMGSEEKRKLMDRYLEEGRPLEEFLKAIGVDLSCQPQRGNQLSEAWVSMTQMFNELKKLKRGVSQSLTHLKEAY